MCVSRVQSGERADGGWQPLLNQVIKQSKAGRRVCGVPSPINGRKLARLKLLVLRCVICIQIITSWGKRACWTKL